MRFPNRWGLAAAAALLCSVTTPGAALDIDVVRYATTDQPRINAAFRASPTDDFITYTTLVFDPDSPDLLREITSVNVGGVFLDTGASGNLLSATTADLMGIEPLQYDPDGPGPLPAGPVTFNDIGIGGTEQFTVSESFYTSLANVNGAIDPNDPASYRQDYGPINFQVAAPPSSAFETEFDVAGMSFMLGKTVVMDLRPSNNLVRIENGLPGNPDIIETSMRTYIYDSGTAFAPATLDTDPGTVPTDLQIQMSYGDFAGFTTVDPVDAPFPTIAHNPFIGTAPVADTGGVAALETPGITVSQGERSTTGSFLFDTGGSVSLLSSAKAAEVGVTLENGNFFIDGVAAPSEDVFSVAIEGVGGEPATLDGIYLDSAVIPTLSGNPSDPDDPNHIHIDRAPFFVVDISLADPNDPSQVITLDGVLGMNYFAPSSEVELLPIGIVQLPFPVNLTESPYDFMVFDEPSGVLGLTLNPGAAQLIGDYNADGTVGAADLALVLSNWGEPVADGQAPDANWLNTAYITAAEIGADELALVLSRWGESTAIADHVNQITAATGLGEAQVRALIPEPGAAAILLGLLLVARPAGRRSSAERA
jgi:hypothetical protein